MVVLANHFAKGTIANSGNYSYRSNRTSMTPARKWLLAATILVATRLLGQGVPIIHPFYGADAPARDAVLAFARTADGELIVGSNILAVFDGWRWQTVDVPEGYRFRGLAAAAQGTPRVWVGGSNAIGYVQEDATGRWGWVSLQPELTRAGVGAPRDILQVQATAQGAIWVTDSAALRWDGAHFTVWQLPAEPRLYASRTAGAMWICQPGTGLLRCGENGPTVAVKEADLPGTPVIWVLERGSAPAVVGTTNAVFLRKHGAWIKLAATSAAVDGKLPSCAVWLGPETFAVGTLHGGLLTATTGDRVISSVDSRMGLPDDAVYSLAQEAHSNLWLGSGIGIAQLTALSHAEIFNRQHGLGSSAVRRVFADGAQTYAITAQGVYSLHPADGDRPIPASLATPAANIPDLLYDAARIDGQLWLAGSSGLWRLAPGGPRLEHPTAKDVLRILGWSRSAGAIAFIENQTLKLLRPVPTGGWMTDPSGIDLGNAPVSLIEDAHGDLWASTMAGGVFRFGALASTGAGVPRFQSELHLSPEHGLPKNTMRPQLTRVGSRIYAFCEDAILQWDEPSKTFTPVKDLADFIGVAATSDPEHPDRAYWLVQRRESTRVFSGLGSVALLHVSVADASASLAWVPLRCPGLEYAYQVTVCDALLASAYPPSLWVGAAIGLLRCDLGSLQPAALPPPVELRQVTVNADQRAALAPGQRTEFRPATNRLEFTFSAELPSPVEPLYYETRLDGVETVWSSPTRQRTLTREFTGLAPGQYAMRIRAADSLGRVGPETAFGFTLLAPWWRTWPAFAAYGAVLTLAAAGLVRWRLARLSQLNERLNRLVTERTRELALANTAKTEFLENVSHEIRNPLNGIVGLIGMLKEQNLRPREREVTRSLKACAQALGRVFDEVLNFAKLEYGAVPVENRPLGLRPLLEEIQRVFSVTAAPSGSRIGLSFPPDFHDGFVGDENKLKSIVSNFVSNALKHAPGSPVDIRVACADSAAQSPAQITIEVVDHGPGIPAEEQELIFQKFVRGSAAKTHGSPGAGLGLATSQANARLLGGVIGVESPSSPAVAGQGPGATFYLQVPLPRGPLPSIAPPLAVDLHGANAAALIVEDQEYNRIVLADIAQELGYVPDEAVDGSEARLRLGEKSYGVVFLDWELPGEKGTEIAKWLRAQPGGAKPVVIATTAHDSDEARRRCRESGMDAFALKPFTTARLRELIAAVHAQRLVRATAQGEGGALRSGGDASSAESWSEALWSTGPLPPSPADSRAAAAPEPEEPELNLAAFDHFSHRSPGQRDPAERYLDVLDRELEMMRVAAEHGTADALARAAHRVRSHAGLIGAAGLTAAARELEAVAHLRSSDTWGPVVGAVVSAAESLKAQIASLARSPSRSG